MNTHLLALQLMAAQGLLGAFDTLYHHELTEALPQRGTARRELTIHATRALIYSALFIGLSAWQWHGLWTVVLFVLFGIEIILTLWDFVVEDRTRLLPATERVTHTVLAINGGAFIALLALNAPAWFALPTQLAWQPFGLLSAFLAVCGVGVGLSGVRDALAARQLGEAQQRDDYLPPVSFGAAAEHVLITGATGFIGQQLVHALLADGKRVIVLTRNPRQAAWLFEGRVQCISRMQALPPGVQVDVIVNLAGARILGWRWSEKRKAVLRDSRIALSRSIVEWIACASHKPRLLISASAIGYYGIQPQGDEQTLTEEAAPQSIFMSQLCQDWESAARRAGDHGVRVVCTRFGLVLGRQGALPMMLMPIKLGLGGPLGSGRQWFSWIHVHDLLRGMAGVWDAQVATTAAAMEHEVYNFTAPEVVTQQQFSRTAADVHRRPGFFPTPGWPVRLLLGEQSDLLLEGQRVVPSRLTAQGFQFSFPDLRSALQNLA